MPVVFVTAFLDLHEPRVKDKTTEARFEYFKKLNATGVRLHVFVSPEHRDSVPLLNNGVVETIALEDLDMYSVSPAGIPDNRSDVHDTRNFLILMNAKIEFIQRAIKSGHHSGAHYAWADFNLYHVLKDPESADELRAIARSSLPDTCMFFPGCWPKGVMWDSVNWRFCGGFFLGDTTSLLNFYEVYRREYPRMPKLTWEVNTWAYLESLGVHFDWYAADHNKTIIEIPRNVICVPRDMPFAWASPDCGLHVNGPMYRYVLECIRTLNRTAIFPKSDGVIGDEEFDRMIASLGREESVVTPGREYRRLETLAENPIICMHSSRCFDSKTLMLMPWSDAVFDNGVSFPQIRWEDKASIAVWRGGSSGFYRPSIRMEVVDRLFGVANTDVRFVRGGWPINDDIIPDYHFGRRMSVEEQLQFKYHLVIDGNTPASNGQWVFATGSVPIIITHPGNRWWADTELRPMVNYVPVKYDLSDLVEKIQWLVDHDEDAKTIAQNALEMSKRVLSPAFQRGYIRNRVRQIAQQGR
jgi:Glycosyl transferase family 90